MLDLFIYEMEASLRKLARDYAEATAAHRRIQRLHTTSELAVVVRPNG